MRLVSCLVGAALLPGCFYRLEPEQRICDDLAVAISERTYVCEDDPDLANERHAEFVEEAECLLPDEVEDPYNPEGILPAQDVPEERERLERLYSCVRAARQADCDRVERRGDDLSWWLTLHESCADVAVIGGGR